MTDTVAGAGAPATFGAKGYPAALEWIARRAEAFAIPLAALVVGMVLFSLFILAVGKSPVQLYETMWRGGFGSWFSVQNSLSRAAPLLLAALCVALPARLGLVVIGGEGAIVLGGVAAAAAGMALGARLPSSSFSSWAWRAWPPAASGSVPSARSAITAPSTRRSPAC